MRKNNMHAVYVVTQDGPCFRVGQPTTWNLALARYDRIDSGDNGRGKRVRWYGRWYTVRWVEVRSVDAHGIGLGSERHGRAVPVPYVACKRTPPRRKVARKSRQHQQLALDFAGAGA
jgi:hypothetical protein